MRRPGLRAEWVGAVAGVVLLVLVFLPWWELDESALRDQGPVPTDSAQVRSFLDLYSAGDTDASAWDASPRAAAVWIALALGALALAAAQLWGLGTFARRGLAAAVAGLGAIALVLAAVRLVDPPYESFSPVTGAYAALAAIVVVLASTALALRRT